MKISFDLDDTLIPGNKTFPLEQQTLLQRLFRAERLRKGAIELFKELKKRNHIVGIYTTSFRSNMKIRLLFWLNGFPVEFVINQKLHLQTLAKSNIRCSKYPAAFNIDLHIDDSEGVEKEGQLYGFKTIVIDENQADWVGFVLKQAELCNTYST